jgi:hypothetical protein
MARRKVVEDRQHAKSPGPGRPRVHREAWAKVSVILFARQVTHLDRFAKKARDRGHKSMTRASIIRGLIDGMLHGGVDPSDHSSERQLRDHISERFRISKPL